MLVKRNSNLGNNIMELIKSALKITHEKPECVNTLLPDQTFVIEERIEELLSNGPMDGVHYICIYKTIGKPHICVYKTIGKPLIRHVLFLVTEKTQVEALSFELNEAHAFLHGIIDVLEIGTRQDFGDFERLFNKGATK